MKKIDTDKLEKIAKQKAQAVQIQTAIEIPKKRPRGRPRGTGIRQKAKQDVKQIIYQQYKKKQKQIEKIAQATKDLIDLKQYSQQELIFCKYFAVTNNANKSAIQAGYANSVQQAVYLRKDQKIQKLVAIYRQEMLDQYLSTNQYIVKQLKQLYQITLSTGDVKTALEVMDRIMQLRDMQHIQNPGFAQQININLTSD